MENYFENPVKIYKYLGLYNNETVEDCYTSRANLCQPEFAVVATPDGLRCLGDINEGDVIWGGKRWTRVIRKVCVGKKKVYKYITKYGRFIGTDDHKIVQMGIKIPIKNAVSIDINVVNDDKPIKYDVESVVDGLFVGGGVYDYIDDVFITSVSGLPEIPGYIAKSGDYYQLNISDKMLGAIRDSTLFHIEAGIPICYYHADRNIVVSFLRGLFSARGEIYDNRVMLRHSHIYMLEQVQDMLSFLGIKSCIVNIDDDGCFVLYELIINTDLDKFADTVGFVQDFKADALYELVNSIGYEYQPTASDIIEIQDLGVYDVYDITVDDPTHTYWTGGLLVSTGWIG